MPSEPLLFLSCPSSIADAIRARVRSTFRGSSTRQIIITLDLANATLATVPQVASADRDSPTVIIGLAPRRIERAQIGRDHVCIDCLHHWMHTAQGDRLGRIQPVSAEAIAPDTLALAARLAARWLSPGLDDDGDRAATADAAANACVTAPAEVHPALVEIDAFSGLRTVHPIVRRRDCPRCRHWRATPPADLRAHYSGRTGIVTTIEYFSTRVASVVAAGAASVYPLARPPAARRAASGTFGYGATVREAENGCIGEALERYCATFHTIDPMHRATLDEASSSIGPRHADEACGPCEALDPRDILLFSDTQYRERERRNPLLPRRHRIPEPFDPRQPIDWLIGRDLASDRPVWVPAACCLLDYPFRPGDAPFASADLSGCASGHTDTDAILHGLLECVERDAHAIWWYTRLARPSIPLEALDDPRLLQMRDQLAPLGHQLTLLDVTTDIGIESCIGLITTHDGRQPVLGSAAHSDPRVAASKAASEAVLNWYCARGGQLPADIAHWVATASVHTAPFLRGTSDSPTRSREAAASETGAALVEGGVARIAPSPQAQLHDCVERLRRVGLRPVAIELTRPDVAVPVWRVIVPGLRHVYDRRAPGRLYEVPVRTGWLPAALAETELNPLSCTF